MTTGTVGQRPVPGAALAAAGAGALEGLVRGLAVELAPIRVNAVRAGAFRTPLWDGVPEAQRDALFTRLAQDTLTGTVGEPEQIAAAHIYLTQNQYVTGTVHPVDGGVLLTRNSNQPARHADGVKGRSGEPSLPFPASTSEIEQGNRQ